MKWVLNGFQQTGHRLVRLAMFIHPMLVVGVVIMCLITHIPGPYPNRQVLPGLEPSRIAATQLRRSKLKPKRGLPKVPAMYTFRNDRNAWGLPWATWLPQRAAHTPFESCGIRKNIGPLWPVFLGAHSPCDSSSAPNIIGGQNWVPKKLVPMALITCLNNLVWFNAIRF